MGAPDTVAIVATGPSVLEHDLSSLSADCVIAVNAAIELVTPDIWFTLDLSPVNRRRINRPVPGVRYVVACGPRCRHRDRMPAHVEVLERIEADNDRLGRPFDDIPEYWLWRWRAKLGLSEDPDAVHTGNSVYGALGLAYHMRPQQIILYGMDGTQDERVTGGYPNRLDHLPMLFESAVPQLKAAGIEVHNANPDSEVTCFEPF